MLLYAVGALTWDYSWWDASAPVLIVIFGYLTFSVVSYWVFDMEKVRRKIIITGIIFAVDLVAILIFGVMPGWL